MNRPQWNAMRIRQELAVAEVEFGIAIDQSKPVLLGVRGYFQDSMGKPGENDRGIYDDAMFLISPKGWASYNANTDPSRHGINDDIDKGYAVLMRGVYDYQLGIHGLKKPRDQQYKALVQLGNVNIKRDGQDKIYAGKFGINIHRGGEAGTSSAGCQTVLRAQWQQFITTVEDWMRDYGQYKIQYALIEEQG